MNYLRRLYVLHANFVPILILFVAFRVMTLLLYKPGGYILGWNDYYFFKDWASFSNQGLYPYLDLWMEHPPLFPWLVVLAYKISLLAPAWSDDLLWFSLTFGLTLLPFEIGNLVLVYAIVSELSGKTTALLAAWVYSSLFLPVFFWTAGFDCYPLFFLLLSVFCAIRSRSALAGIATGLGLMVKLVPAVAAPVILVALLAKTKTKALTYCLAAGGTALLVAALFALANPTMLVASFRSMLSRSSWETVWALLDGYYGSGRGVASPSMRLDPATAAITHHTSDLPWVWITLAFGALLVYLLTRNIAWQQPRKLVAVVALALNLFILYSKGYSPQFVVYPLAFIIIIFPNLRGIIYSLLLSVVNVAEYPFALIVFEEWEWLVTTTVLLRTALIAALSVEYLSVVFEGRLLAWTKVVLPAVASVVVLAMAAFSWAGIDAYFRRSASTSMFREPIAFLEASPPATLVFTDNSAFEQLYPFLRSRHDFVLTDGTVGLGEMRFRDNIWLIYTGTNEDRQRSSSAAMWLAERAFPVDNLFLTNARLTRYSSASLVPKATNAKFAEVARLVAYAADEEVTSGGELHVGLRWQAMDKTARPLKVFVHAIGSQGEVAAQHDSEPAAGLRPTGSWQPGDEIVDNHGLLLPASMPAGVYRLLVGLYDGATGIRITTASGGDYVELGTVTVSSAGMRNPTAVGQ